MRKVRVFGITVIATVALLMLAAWLTIRRGFSAHDEPSAIEHVLATAARSLAVPSSYKTLKNPQMPTPENFREGLEHFADHCAACHANDGSGDTMFGKGLYPKPPDLRGEETQDKPDGEIYHIIENGIRLSGMPAFGEKGRTDSKSTWNLVLFIRHLPKLTPEEIGEMEHLNPRSFADWEQQRMEQEFLRGAEPKPRATHKHP
ncbi:MAG: cytochrome c [Acidobacteriales bacterium]|nr:cytochrome c [Terriglobales bacterium]